MDFSIDGLCLGFGDIPGQAVNEIICWIVFIKINIIYMCCVTSRICS